ncbi:HNH endonuclease [Leptospira weilii str. 2006001853]|uniref:HNH endonuclease n=2 Tax=Leptospira weilii TaxID=28184 RepID=A0A828Z755_9LEPT|nr:HNH endonuclease [Leptospira weilii]EMM70805.1 HNH endonuclease [Leptospira weilii str. 2006001855]EKR66158.1 HNH endonuclease [Leptospira weilii str. 2006001853]MCL8268637.1 HNH endonuclease [Leptospira weilii]QDK22182.1 HNH endonuclease [Leptospira weilii]QDK26127.1 HNH endonuclease [Leptospira weilii]
MEQVPSFIDFKKIIIIGNRTQEKNCAICKREFSNKIKPSREHLFPESIGGTITVFGIYCIKCNSTLGKGIDKDLFENFQFPATVLNVFRSNSNPLPNFKVKLSNSGDQKNIAVIKPGGLIQQDKWIEEEISNNKRNIKIRGNTEQEILNKAIKVEKSLLERKKPYHKGAIKELDRSVILEESLMDFDLSFSTGNLNVLLSILKMAFTYCLKENVPLEFISHIPSLLKKEDKRLGIVIPYPYPRLSSDEISKLDIYHSILLIGVSKQNELFAVVELFSCFKYHVFLSSRFEGPDFATFISQNCITGNEKSDPKPTLNYEIFVTPKEITEAQVIEGFEKQVNPFRSLIDRIIWSHLLDKKLDFDFGPLKKGEIINESRLQEILVQRIHPNPTFEILNH